MTTEKNYPQIVLKLLILGDSSVGKTCILLKYVDNKFEESNIATVGVDYMDKMIEYKNFNIKLQIWDTSGEERYRSITKNFYRNADGLFVVFDLTRKVTYERIKDWINEAEEYNKGIKKILIGNKLDLENKREVKKDSAENFAKKNNLKYIETSAKDGTNIKESFDEIIELILGGKNEQDIVNEYTQHDSSLSVNTDGDNKNKKKQCC